MGWNHDSGIVATQREVILTVGNVSGLAQMLVLCAFLLTLSVMLRYAGVRNIDGDTKQPG